MSGGLEPVKLAEQLPVLVHGLGESESGIQYPVPDACPVGPFCKLPEI